MAENQSLNAPKQEEERPIEQEEEGEEKLLPKIQNSLIPIGVVSDCCTNEGLMTIKGSQAEPHVDSLSNSAKLDVKPVNATSLASPEPTEFKGQFVELHQEVLASAKVQATQAQACIQLQAECPPALEIPPLIIKQPMPSAISPMPLQKLPTLEQNNNVCEQEVDQDSSSDVEIKPTCFTVKAPANDGYNWRKYGHKLVKSSESSRSYYRCTTIDCHAKKKVECCDHSGKLIEISYKGRHNHDPPREVRRHKARKLASSTMLISSSEPGGDSGLIDCPVTVDIYSDPSTFRREPGKPTPGQQLSAKECDQAMSIKSEEYFDEPHSEHRMKGSAVMYPSSLFKAVKESKVVVQAPGDIGISGDGYRWRKYGQKMVKGNPNPRSYYKCTSAGCPVRKHVERSIEDTTTFVITYEGKHDHDMPIPKKRHGSPNASLLISAAPAMNNPELKESKALDNHKISAQLSMDLEDPLTKEKETECGGQKVLKSTQTLLSIGIELRPY